MKKRSFEGLKSNAQLEQALQDAKEIVEAHQSVEHLRSLVKSVWGQYEERITSKFEYVPDVWTKYIRRLQQINDGDTEITENIAHAVLREVSGLSPAVPAAACALPDCTCYSPAITVDADCKYCNREK